MNTPTEPVPVNAPNITFSQAWRLLKLAVALLPALCFFAAALGYHSASDVREAAREARERADRERASFFVAGEPDVYASDSSYGWFHRVDGNTRRVRDGRDEGAAFHIDYYAWVDYYGARCEVLEPCIASVDGECLNLRFSRTCDEDNLGETHFSLVNSASLLGVGKVCVCARRRL